MSSVQSLLSLLESIQGQEPAKMTPIDRESFRSATLTRFRAESVCLTELLSDVVGHRIDGYLSQVTLPANPYFDEWLGTYLIVESHLLEQFLDAPEKVQMLAAMSPPIAFKLDLFSEAHHPGFSHPAHLLLRLVCHDDPAVMLFEEVMTSVAPSLQRVCGVTAQFRIFSHEGACVDIVRPKDIASAVATGIRAIRAEAIANEPDPELRYLEGFGFEVMFDATTPPLVVFDGIRILMTVFDRVLQTLQSMGNEPNR